MKSIQNQIIRIHGLGYYWFGYILLGTNRLKYMPNAVEIDRWADKARPSFLLLYKQISYWVDIYVELSLNFVSLSISCINEDCAVDWTGWHFLTSCSLEAFINYIPKVLTSALFISISFVYWEVLSRFLRLLRLCHQTV